MSSSSEGENYLPGLSELNQWTKPELQDWLVKRHLKKSGNKNVLANRVFRAMNSLDSSSGESSDTDSDDTKDFDFPSADAEEWCVLSTDKAPPVTEKDIMNYFLYRKDPVRGKRKQSKRHMKKARKFAAERNYIDTIYFHEGNEMCCFIKCQCAASMKDINYNVIVCLIKETGKIDSGKCTCKAGEAGTCAHIGAILFRVQQLKDACTSTLSKWVVPNQPKEQANPARLEDIKIYKAEKTQKPESKVKPYPGVYQASACNDPDVFMQDLLKELGDVNPECALYQTLRKPPNIDDLMSSYFPTNAASSSGVDLDINQQVQNFVSNLEITKDMCEKIEQATKGQGTNPNWLKARTLVLTSSRFGDICKLRDSTNRDNIVKSLRGYTRPPADLKPLRYGRKMESRARRDYAIYHHKQCGPCVTLEDRGLIINPKYPFLGSSIDGLVICGRCGTGVLEIKCPHSLKKVTPLDGPTCLKQFCCTTLGNGLKLKDEHNYMYQVQGEMAVCDLMWADFVIWTKKGIHVERIHFNPQFWDNTYLKLKLFYTKYFVPELLTKKVESGLSLHE